MVDPPRGMPATSRCENCRDKTYFADTGKITGVEVPRRCFNGIQMEHRLLVKPPRLLPENRRKTGSSRLLLATEIGDKRCGVLHMENRVASGTIRRQPPLQL